MIHRDPGKGKGKGKGKEGKGREGKGREGGEKSGRMVHEEAEGRGPQVRGLTAHRVKPRRGPPCSAGESSSAHHRRPPKQLGDHRSGTWRSPLNSGCRHREETPFRLLAGKIAPGACDVRSVTDTKMT
jgi:hypothetical protein